MKKTVIVLGNYRGGTTMITGVLMKLGIFMGDPTRMRSHREDMDFWNVSPEQAQATINQRNKEHDTWGWKYPGAYEYVGKLDIRNPHYVVIFRDPYSVAKSEEGRKETIYFPEKYTTLLAAMGRVNDCNRDMMYFADNVGRLRPGQAHLTSYEHWARNPKAEVERLKLFLGIDSDETEALRFLDFQSHGYRPIKKVYVAGVWDLMHFGHIEYLKRARKLGDHLTVAVLTDEGAANYKPEAPVVSFEHRKRAIEALGVADKVVAQRDTDPTMYGELQDASPDVLVYADDRARAVGGEWMEARGRQTVCLPYAKGISSTEIKQRVRSRD